MESGFAEGDEVGIQVIPALRSSGFVKLALIFCLETNGREGKGESEAAAPGPNEHQALIHIHADAIEPGRVFKPDLAIHSGLAEFAEAAAAKVSMDSLAWDQWRWDACRDYQTARKTAAHDVALDLAAVMAEMERRLPDDAFVTVDAGNFSGWPQRFLSFGGFGMTGQELATAVQYGAAPLILVFNNAMYGTIRMHQERRHPGRVIGTDFVNPDFAAMARSFGAYGETVTRTEEFVPAFKRAAACGKAAVIELKTNPDTITNRTTLTAVREAARQGENHA
jgi:acetolactate synthase-1/2/3 large subunit